MAITMLGVIEHTYKNMECQGDQSIDLYAATSGFSDWISDALTAEQPHTAKASK